MADTTEAAKAVCELTGIVYAEGEGFRSDAEGHDATHVVLRYEGNRKLVADNRAWARVDEWSCSLYSQARDPGAEEAVERAFDASGIVPSDPMRGYDDESGLYWVEWDFELPRTPETP